MNALPRITALFVSEKPTEAYFTCKYEDIKREWIVHEGNLEYLSGETLFKCPISRKCLGVLTSFINDSTENLVILYLYPEKTKSPYKCFSLERNDQLNDRCRKLIEGKTGLFFMELVINKTGNGEIFGVRSVPERKLWMEKFEETVSKSRYKPIGRSTSDVHSSRPKSSSSSEECPFPVRSTPINYTAFKANDTNVHLPPIQSLPTNLFAHRSCIESLVIKPTVDYQEIKATPPANVAKGKAISWETIFYPNRNNDFTMILNNIGQTGVFLVRPQLAKSYTGDHDYTLCVYDNGHIYKFALNRSSDQRYLLKCCDIEPSFPSISELCVYYTAHPLHVSVREGLNRDIYLIFPYTHKNLYF